jgi:hypothetical protein
LPDTQFPWKKRNVQKILTHKRFWKYLFGNCGNRGVILMKVVNRPFVRNGIIRNWLRIICFVLLI